MRLFQWFLPTRMWSLMLFLGVCSTHRTTGTEITRGNYLVDTVRENTGIKTLAKLTPINSNLEFDTTLDLSRLELRSIELHVFDSLTELTSLDLSKNRFSNIPKGVFSELHNLETLSLAYNNIYLIHPTSFVGLDNLKLLDLSNNLLNNLERKNLLNLPKSTEIVIKDILVSHLSSTNVNSSSQVSFPWKDYGHPSQYKLDEEVFRARFKNPFPNIWEQFEAHPFHVEVCLTEDGLLESVSIAAEGESSGDCLEAFVVYRKSELRLNDLAIKEFGSGWYQIPDNYFTLIDLSDNDITEITTELLNGLPSSISAVKLDNNKIQVIKNGVIENRFLKVLSLKSNSISSIGDGAFEKTNLESLHVTSNFLTNLNFTRTLPTNVTELFLENNEISEISEYSFVNLKALVYLIMPRNRLTFLPSNTLRGLKELREINFADNLLKTIDSGTFSDNEKIDELLLSHNQIKELPAGLFNGLKMVKKIALDGNQIEKVSGDTFLGIKNIIIHYLKLDGNEIDTIEEGSFANMFIKELHLAKNKLSDKSIAKGAFESCKADKLKLNNNSFTSIAVEALSELKLYGSLDLSNNQINNINPGDAKYMTHIGSLHLEGNEVNQLVKGALYGFPKDQDVHVFFGKNLNSVQVGVFDDA